HLLVMDLIILLNSGQALGVECNQVPLPILQQFLREDSLCSKVRQVGFDAEGVVIIREHKDGVGCDHLLQAGNGGLLGLLQALHHILSHEVTVREILYEATIEVGETQEGLHLLLVLQHWPVCYTSHLD
ncbi:hypothetical protein DXG03_002055, partial [Asterophora parasitica]